MFGITMPGTGSPEECAVVFHEVSGYAGPVKDRISGKKEKGGPLLSGLIIRNKK
jgi:hypothetical protein